MIEERWVTYLEEPSRILREEADAVERLSSLIQRYPYCQALQLLHCRTLKETGALEWKDLLNGYAPLVPDRKKLYRLLMEEAREKTASVERTSSKMEEEEGGELSEASPQEGKEAPSQEEGGVDPAPLEQEILSQAVHYQILNDPEETLGKGVETEEDEGEVRTKSQEDLSGEEGIFPQRSFTDWLDPGPSFASPGEEASSLPARKEQKKLLEAFIQQGAEGPIRSEKSEFFSSQRMARKSSEEDDMPVSETLAELYVQQGDLKRAKQAFERLALKVPEKSDYFARRVKELEMRSKR